MAFQNCWRQSKCPRSNLYCRALLAAVAYRLSQLCGPVLLLGVSEVTGSHPAEESHGLMVSAIGNSC